MDHLTKVYLVKIKMFSCLIPCADEDLNAEVMIKVYLVKIKMFSCLIPCADKDLNAVHLTMDLK